MALTDTLPEAEAAEAPPTDGSPPPAPPQITVIESTLGSSDHKAVGRMWILTGLTFLALDLVVSAIVNADTASRASLDLEGFLARDAALRLALNTPLGLLLCGALPVFIGLATYIIPLQVGSPTVSFPRAAAAAFWSWVMSAVIFLVAVAADGSYGGTKVQLARLGNVAVGAMMIALSVAAVCVAVTVLTLRAEGMTLRRVPMFSWSMLVAASLWTLTLSSALARVVLIHIQRPNADTVAAGWGDLSWLFHQPALYIAAIPVLGLAADIVPVMAQVPQQLRGVVQGAIGAFGLLSFGAWTQGLDSTQRPATQTFVWVAFAVAAGLPLLGLLGGLADTLRRGRPQAASPLAFAIVSLLLLLLAALTGALEAVSTTGKGNLFDVLDLPPVAGISVGQYSLVIAAVVAAALGGLFYWGPKLWGGAPPENAGRGLAPLVLLGGVLYGASHVVLGLVIPDGGGYRPFAAIAAVGAVLLALAALGGVGASLSAARFAASGPRDPWGGHTLEWSVASPPPVDNFDAAPVVESATPLFQSAGATDAEDAVDAAESKDES